VIAASVNDFREMARRRLPRLIFDYLDGGAYAEITLGRNVTDLEALALRQRVMRDVSKLSMTTTWFGQETSMPVGLGPVGFSGMFARRGEVQAARAAHRAGVPFCLSTVGICSVEEVTKKSRAPVWYQLYMVKDRGFMGALLERVAAQKSPVLLFTVDLPVAGARYRDVRSGMSAPPSLAVSLSRILQGI
jgi:L-lactate dehydrogenase (cytochrome)